MSSPSALPYATLEIIRVAILRRRIVSFQHENRKYLAEPYALALSPRYGAYLLVGRVIDDDRVAFFRYAHVRDLHVTQDAYNTVSADFNHTDRRIGSIDTSVPRRAKQYA